MNTMPRVPKAAYMIGGAVLMVAALALAAYIIYLLGDAAYFVLWGVMAVWLGGAIGKWTYEGRVHRAEAERRYAEEKQQLDEIRRAVT